MSSNIWYGINSLARLHWATWDDEFVVFDEASGQTHRMDALRGLILDVLAEKTCTFEHLVQEAMSVIEPGSEGYIPAQLHAILDDFLKYGLVEVKAA